ncbi:MFS transporter [Gordonia polyisoprenivorans]|uniref:MFS transporter n=1 Tax=Gordonia polyisoprenivorans TaxID=84595 RepID=UPI001F0B5D07|nr:MFS transporter [Gordonia polyisoprenivorans]
MRTLLTNATFGRLYLAQIVSLAGTGLMTVALGLLAYRLAGDDAAQVLGAALAVKMVAYVVMAPVMRALLARFSPARVLIGADLTRTAMAACLPWVEHTWQIYLLIFALQTASATFTPTFSATLAHVVADEVDYTAAVSASRAAYDLEALLSPLLAAALLTVWSYSTLFACTAVGFVCSALLVRSSGLHRTHLTSPTMATFVDRLGSGVRIMFGHRVFRRILWTNLAVAAATAVVFVGTVVYVRADLHASDSTVAVALAAFGGGSLVATLLVPVLSRRVGVAMVLLAGAGTCAVGLAGAAWWLAAQPSAAALLLTWVVLGAATSLVNTTVPRLIRDRTPTAVCDDVFAAQFSLSHAGFLLTYSIAGWGPALVGSAGTVGVLAVVAAVATGFATWTGRADTADESASSASASSAAGLAISPLR